MNILDKLKGNGQDFEWYPTTSDMIVAIRNDLKQEHFWADGYASILDCGAGDGKTLKAISFGGDMYAIEKAQMLIDAMDKDIFIVGTDFYQNTLIDKKVDIIFSNPPYSEYEMWACKIVAEANAAYVYLIVPNRWQNSDQIRKAIKSRNAESKIIGSFDFTNAARVSRAKVDIIRIDLRRTMYDRTCDIDPFDAWFETHFEPNADKSSTSEWEYRRASKKKLKKQVRLVKGGNIINALVELYDAEMSKLQSNFRLICNLDHSILKELNVDTHNIKGGLKQRIEGLKHKYWHEFFDHCDMIINRLTSASRRRMLDKLHAHTSIDFTADNAYAVAIWAIKNANKFYDAQLIQVVESMVTSANTFLYKSNQRLWEQDDWRYGCMPEDYERYGLELRMVLHRKGGLSQDYFDRNRFAGLSECAYTFIGDLLTIAYNLGYNTAQEKNLITSREWISGSKHLFYCESHVLMEIKAFKNGNLHIKFDQGFIRKLNIEFGRLKGWLNDKDQAANELNIPVIDIDFDINFKLSASNVKMLTYQ